MRSRPRGTEWRSYVGHVLHHRHHDRPVTSRSLRRRSVPQQLPPPVPGFVARRFYLEELTRLANIDDDGLSAAVLCGTSGVGKTALAVQWAHENLNRFPDGQLYMDLRGSGTASRPVQPGDALVRFLLTLGVHPIRMPITVDEKAALYRTLLAGRRTLILLDNAHSPAQVRPLLPGSPTSMVLVTSRDRLAGLVAANGATRIELDPFDSSEAVMFERSRALLAPLGSDGTRRV